MRVSVKTLEGTKWKQLNLKEVIGQSIAHYISTTSKTCVAALLDAEGKPEFFLTNNETEYNKYKLKGLAYMIDDFIMLLGSSVVPDNEITQKVAQVFPDATFEVLEKSEDAKKWW
jgi:hypothetical protein